MKQFLNEILNFFEAWGKYRAQMALRYHYRY